MQKKDRSREELALEVEKLRAQLAEAEETLRAIRSGEVDAFVLSGEKGEQVFTLKGAEHPYRILIEGMEEGAVTLGADNSILYCNSGFARMMKTPLEKLMGTSISHFISPADWDVFEELLHRGESSIGEISFVAGDGTHVPMYLSLNSLQQDGMALINLVAVDLTERKRAEEELRRAHDELEIRVEERTAELVTANEELNAEIMERERAEEALSRAHDELELRVLERTAQLQEATTASMESEERYRELAESIGEVFYAMDRKLIYTYWNNASETLTGILAKDAIGKSLFELFPELKGTRTEGLYREVLFTQQVRHFVSRYRAGEKIFTFEINAYPSRLGLSVIAKDITKSMRSGELIREQAALLDKARDTIAVRDLEHRLIYWNKGAQRMYGWTAEEVLGRNADELLYKEESSKLIEAKKTVIEKGEWIGELDQVTKKGNEIIVESRWTLVQDSNGRPKSILIINTDITEKKRLEVQFLRSQRMESIGTLAGGIAHDLNNVLTPMMLSLQLLKEKFKDEQSQKLLTILEQNSWRGANLIKQVLSFARGIEGERNPLFANNIISEIEKVTKETFPKNIEFRTDLKKDLFTISGDATQLYQVIMNLCVNARDAMPDGGILSVTSSNFFIDENYEGMHSEAKAGSYVLISVSDTGTGIPPRLLERIFEPFFTTKEFGKGTGLGLSTVLAIVKGHGGFINVYSEVGKGTKFTVYLPAIKTEVQKEEEQLELSIGHGELILVAEDEDSIREITSSTLEKYGYKVLTANDGAQAVALYAQNKDRIKVVLMDIMMPVMDGHASIRAIHKINPEVKVIAVSGLADNDAHGKFGSSQAKAFLSKPYTAHRLLKAINICLHKQNDNLMHGGFQ
ncbi:MAG: PAS domain S-box protein [Candidatus Methanoperedens sp.]|nr:PAS domain S-box protein [Candidatus Methanoperedens sp.]CAG0957932.1 two-component system, cell cycle sensor histidine kinase and response regulator CckA [Methanosarcinales archaeon]